MPDELDIDELCIDSTSGKNLKLLRKMSEKGVLFHMKKSSGRLLNGSKNKVDNTSCNGCNAGSAFVKRVTRSAEYQRIGFVPITFIA